MPRNTAPNYTISKGSNNQNSPTLHTYGKRAFVRLAATAASYSSTSLHTQDTTSPEPSLKARILCHNNKTTVPRVAALDPFRRESKRSRQASFDLGALFVVEQPSFENSSRGCGILRKHPAVPPGVRCLPVQSSCWRKPVLLLPCGWRATCRYTSPAGARSQPRAPSRSQPHRRPRMLDRPKRQERA